MNDGSLIRIHYHENKQVLDGLSDNNGNLYYKGIPIFIQVSKEAHNAIIKKEDGIYVDNSYFLTAEQYNAILAHLINGTIHVTQEDKELWNATLDNAKDYAKKLFDKVTSFNIEIVNELPTEDIKEMSIYFLQIDEEDNDCYEEWMYIKGEWEKIGNTRIDLTPYLKIEDFNQIIKDYAKKDDLHEHLNKEILDKITEDYISTDEDVEKAIQDILNELGGIENDT